MSVWPLGDPWPLLVFWLDAVAELLLVAISDTMEVGEVVSDDEALDELELVELRMVDEVTEVGGVSRGPNSELGGELPATSWALS